jgi:hypothetical protein
VRGVHSGVPASSGSTTPSLLEKLGGLLRKAFEIAFLVTIAETVVTVLDAPLELRAVTQDTETIAGWAEQAAGAITSDLSWGGGLFA